MVSLVTLISIPILVGILIYGTTLIFSPHKDVGPKKSRPPVPTATALPNHPITAPSLSLLSPSRVLSNPATQGTLFPAVPDPVTAKPQADKDKVDPKQKEDEENENDDDDDDDDDEEEEEEDEEDEEEEDEKDGVDSETKGPHTKTKVPDQQPDPVATPAEDAPSDFVAPESPKQRKPPPPTHTASKQQMIAQRLERIRQERAHRQLKEDSGRWQQQHAVKVEGVKLEKREIVAPAAGRPRVGQVGPASDKQRVLQVDQPASELETTMTAPTVAASEADDNTKTTAGDRDASKELEQWINHTSEQQSAVMQVYLIKIMQEILEEPTGFEDVIFALDVGDVQEPTVVENQNQQQQQLHEQSLEQERDERQEEEGDQRNNFKESGLIDNPAGFIKDLPKILLKLLQPFILQLRADIRNTLIWICSGALNSTIEETTTHNGAGLDEAAQLAAEKDRAKVIDGHPDGSINFWDIFDGGTLQLVLDCLKSHWGVIWQQIVVLFWERFQQAKVVLLDQVRDLIGLPRFMIPFSAGGYEEGKGKGTVLVAQDVVDGEHCDHAAVDEKRGRPPTARDAATEAILREGARRQSERSEAFAAWLVERVMSDFGEVVEDGTIHGELTKQQQQQRQHDDGTIFKAQAEEDATEKKKAELYTGPCKWMAILASNPQP